MYDQENMSLEKIIRAMHLQNSFAIESEMLMIFLGFQSLPSTSWELLLLETKFKTPQEQLCQILFINVYWFNNYRIMYKEQK